MNELKITVVHVPENARITKMCKGNALKVYASCLIHALTIFIHFERHSLEFLPKMNHSVYRMCVHRTKGKCLAPWCHRPQSTANNSYKYNIWDTIIVLLPTKDHTFICSLQDKQSLCPPPRITSPDRAFLLFPFRNLLSSSFLPLKRMTWPMEVNNFNSAGEMWGLVKLEPSSQPFLMSPVWYALHR